MMARCSRSHRTDIDNALAVWQRHYERQKPPSSLVQGTDGNFYGTTEAGGTNAAGTVFKITSEGTLTTLWQFGSDVTNGINPFAALVQGSDSNFYGTTFASGINGSGQCSRSRPKGH